MYIYFCLVLGLNVNAKWCLSNHELQAFCKGGHLIKVRYKDLNCPLSRCPVVSPGTIQQIT